METNNHGIVHNIVHFGSSAAEQAVGLGFGVAEDAIAELRRVAGLAIDLYEAGTQSVARIARGANARFCDLLTDAAAHGRATALSAVHIVRAGGDHVSALAGDVLARPQDRRGETVSPRSVPPATA